MSKSDNTALNPPGPLLYQAGYMASSTRPPSPGDIMFGIVWPDVLVNGYRVIPGDTPPGG